MKIYTDGATSKNGQAGAPGGWAYVAVENDKVIHYGAGHIENATNNICELKAIIEACVYAEQNAPFFNVTIYSDSSYCINCYKQKWYERWLRNGWLNSKKESVANQELWEELIPYFNDIRFSFEKVPGHSGNKFNEMADRLAVGAKKC